MKKSILIAILAATTIFTTSCSKDDDITTTVTAENLTANIDENSSAGTVLGKVKGTSNTGTVTYAILSQSTNGALAINATNGDVTIADATLFDFETNPQFTANVEVADGIVKESATITINLNDKDDIEFLLSTSKTKYKNATNGNWIEITKEEYENLAQKLNQTQKVGVSDSDFISNYNDFIDGFKNYSLVTYSNGIMTLPKEAYVIGFKYVSRTDNTRTNDQVKTSSNSSNRNGFINIGGKLPSHAGKGEHFFIIKNNINKSSTVGYLGFYSSDIMGCKRNSFRVQYQSGNTDTLPNLWGGACYYQGLSTTQKQW